MNNYHLATLLLHECYGIPDYCPPDVLTRH